MDQERLEVELGSRFIHHSRHMIQNYAGSS